MAYLEPLSASVPQRERLFQEVSLLIQNCQLDADRKRARFFAPDFSSISAYSGSLSHFRSKLIDMLGWPLTELPSSSPSAQVEKIGEDELGRIYRIHVPTIGPVNAYGLLFLPPSTGRYPLVITQHGGLGAPEVAASITPDGSFNYNKLVKGIREKKSHAIFVPQLLVWHDGQEPKINQYMIDRNLRQLGGSRAALDLSMLRRLLDWLVLHPEINPERVGMAGLSYGGFYTLFFSALDTRIKVAVSSCFANNRYKYNWEDWVWIGSANLFFDAEVASMVCPRPLFIEVGEKDEVFAVDGFSPVDEKVRGIYQKLGIPDHYESRIHPGTHEYDTDGKAEQFLLRWL